MIYYKYTKKRQNLMFIKILFKRLFLLLLFSILPCTSVLSKNGDSDNENYKTTSQERKKTITGVVLDKDNQPLIGATVVVKGSTQWVTTDLSGQFKLEVTDSDELEISFLGYVSKTVKIGSNQSFSIVLEEDIRSLEDAVIIGYGTSKRNDLTSSIASIKSKTIESDKSTSFTGILAGRIPGVLAISTDGAPGAKTNVIIRGASSVSGGISPLYVVDGILMDGSQDEITASSRVGDAVTDPLSMINPDDIVSMEILKDASATAIYGSRGANGVIIVTTKSGAINQTPEIKLSYDAALDTEPKMIEMLNGYDYENYMASLYPLMRNNDGSLTPQSTLYWNEDGTVKHSGKSHNWQKEILRRAITHNVNASIIGGSKNASYALTAGYFNKDGIAIGSSMERFTYGGKWNVNVNKWLKVGLDLKGSQIENNGIISSDRFTSNNIFIQMLIYNPTLDITDKPSDISKGDGNNTINNPVVNATQGVQCDKTSRIQGLGYAEITLMEGMKLKSSFGGYINSTKTKNYYPKGGGIGFKHNGLVNHAENKITNWLNENTLSFNRTFNKDHNVTALLGLTFEQTITDALSIQTSDLMVENLGAESLKYGQLLNVPANNLNKRAMVSFLARVGYSYKNKYLFNASIRADGSSIFPKGNKFSYFPSCAVAWKINEEKFMKNAKWIDLLKLRFSYGQTGNQRIGVLSSLATLRTVYYSFNSGHGKESPNIVQGFAPKSIGNDILKWETTTQYNAGLDFMTFKGRLSLTVDAYYKETRDLLITEQLPSISGFQSAVRNIGKVSNKGMEFMLSSINIEKPNFTWITDLNISFNRNRVEEIGNGDRISVSSQPLIFSGYKDIFYVREGYPLGAMFGYVWDGIYQLQDFKEFYDKNGNFITDPIRQKDIYNNTKKFTLKDGVVNNGFAPPYPGALKPKKIGDSDKPVNPDEDRVYLGSAEPLFFGGITNNFTYKNLSLNILCTFSYGNKLFNANKALIHGRNTANISKEFYENSWTIDHQDAKWPKVCDFGMMLMPSTLNVEDASYFKIKDITLSYNFPKKIIKRVGLHGLKVYVSAKNVAIITHYSWYDPEHIHPNFLMSAVDRYSYPTTITFLFGAKINF